MDERVMDSLACEIRYLHDSMPDVFFYADGVGLVQAWKSNEVFHMECEGIKGEYYHAKFTAPYEIVSTCETYFNALRCGYPLWEV